MPRKIHNHLVVCRSIDGLVPELKDKIPLIEKDLEHHRIPAKLFETTRTVERQKYLLNIGSSKTMKSKHIVGRAVDFVIYDERGNWTWDYKKYSHLYQMLGALLVYKYGLVWGGNWKDFQDVFHFQLPIKV